jgi:hypothetical protein
MLGTAGKLIIGCTVHEASKLNQAGSKPPNWGGTNFGEGGEKITSVPSSIF